MSDGKIEMSAVGAQAAQQGNGRKTLSRFGNLATGRRDVLKEDAFQAMLTIERRRAERSGKPFALMVIDTRAVHKNGNATAFVAQLTSAVSNATRETDFVGWYEEGVVLAVIFTEINLDEQNPVREILDSNIAKALHEGLDHRAASSLVVSVHIFPESWVKTHPDRVADSKLYPDLSE